MSQTHLKMLVGSGYGLHFAGCLGCFLPAVRVLALGKPVFGGKTMAGEKSRALMVDTPRSTDGGHSEVNRPGLYRHTCSPGSLTWDLRTTAPTLSQRSGANPAPVSRTMGRARATGPGAMYISIISVLRGKRAECNFSIRERSAWDSAQ